MRKRTSCHLKTHNCYALQNMRKREHTVEEEIIIPNNTIEHFKIVNIRGSCLKQVAMR